MFNLPNAYIGSTGSNTIQRNGSPVQLLDGPYPIDQRDNDDDGDDETVRNALMISLIDKALDLTPK